MTSSSSPGIALKQEELHTAVVLNFLWQQCGIKSRGPGLEVYNLHSQIIFKLQEVVEMSYRVIVYAHLIIFKNFLT